jgi:hypothetical protein
LAIFLNIGGDKRKNGYISHLKLTKMKLKALFSAAIVALLIASCGKKPQDLLSAKTWKATSLDVKGSTPLSDSLKNAIMSTSSFQFMKDGSYVVNMGREDKGTYTLDKEGKTMTTKSTNGGSDGSYTIVELTADKLVMEDNTAKITCSPK